MKKSCLLFWGIFLIIFLSFSFGSKIHAQENDYICGVYFTGVGCPHCAYTDPYVLKNWLKENTNFVVIEYEIYQEKTNAPLLFEYDNSYHSGLGIPLLILNKNKIFIGDRPIIDAKKEIFNEKNECPLPSGGKMSLTELDFNSLPGKPKIWHQEKILIKNGNGEGNELLKNLLLNDNLGEALKDKAYKKIEPEKVALSGQYLEFENAIELNGWLFQWNGQNIENSTGALDKNEINNNQNEDVVKTELTLAKIISLAAVDAVNPCAFAVLTLMLIAILTYNPGNKKKILLAGLAFVLSVFVMYLIYGIIIIRFFQLIQALTSIRLILYKILAILAIILGLFNIKDFIKYKPGGFLTEMPMFLRPKVKKIIEGVTSPKGAIGVGAFVTLFLLPCTIGPYVICGGILCTLDFLKTLPYLILYNLIFVLPMLIIVMIVYKGFAKIQDVSGWKDKNIRYLHLVAGLLMLGLGLGMLLGLF